MRNLLGTKRGHLLAQLEVGLAELLGKRSPHSCLRVEDQANTTTTEERKEIGDSIGHTLKMIAFLVRLHSYAYSRFVVEHL